MKTFNTMNTLFAASAMSVGISMGTSAHAGLVYNGYYEVEHQDYAAGSDYYAYDLVFAEDSTDFYSWLYYWDGWGDNDAVLFASEDSFDYSSQIYGNTQALTVDLYMEVTFDTATEVLVWYGSAWGEEFFETDIAQGTYLYGAGETMSFHFSVDQFMEEAGTNFYITFTEVPAPGAIALLGLAGIATRRRRK